jgi:hypothetical protein
MDRVPDFETKANSSNTSKGPKNVHYAHIWGSNCLFFPPCKTKSTPVAPRLHQFGKAIQYLPTSLLTNNSALRFEPHCGHRALRTRYLAFGEIIIERQIVCPVGRTNPINVRFLPFSNENIKSAVMTIRLVPILFPELHWS